jgi:hypothetical protein
MSGATPNFDERPSHLDRVIETAARIHGKARNTWNRIASINYPDQPSELVQYFHDYGGLVDRVQTANLAGTGQQTCPQPLTGSQVTFGTSSTGWRRSPIR